MCATLAGLIAVLAVAGLLPLGLAAAADEEESATELAKKTQNPVADLISVPFQNDFNFDTGSKDATVYILNVQPVIPINLTKDWNLITRTIIPIINQPSLFPGPDKISGSAVGLGDINPSFFLSPAKPGHFIWGLGPTFTARSPNQQWSVTGWGDKSVSQFLIQPFVNYNLGDGWYLTSAPIMTANWKNDSGHQWTVPVGGGVGKLFKAGKLPINTQLQGFCNAETTGRDASDWQLRFQVQFLLPKF